MILEPGLWDKGTERYQDLLPQCHHAQWRVSPSTITSVTTHNKQNKQPESFWTRLTSPSHSSHPPLISIRHTIYRTKRSRWKARETQGLEENRNLQKCHHQRWESSCTHLASPRHPSLPSPPPPGIQSTGTREELGEKLGDRLVEHKDRERIKPAEKR